MASSKSRRDKERKAIKNARARETRLKERIIQKVHEYGRLYDVKIHLSLQKGDDMTVYRNTSDKRFPPSHAQMVSQEHICEDRC